MTDPWSERAALYVESDAHREGEDLDQLVAWAAGARTALDVATGGGHVARRLREEGIEVVTTDRAPGMKPDVICPAEELPFADASFDVVACRTAAHHFADVPAAVRQIHRILRPGGSLLLQDILGHDDADANAFILEVEKRRDPSHVRSYRATEWKAFLRAAGLTVMEDSVIWKLREWNEWTGRMRMTAEARRALEDFVRRAPERCRVAFQFRLTPDAIVSFNDRQVLIRADRD